MRYFVFLIACSLQAATSLQVGIPSQTEVMVYISLTAPTGAPCTFEASYSPTYTPPINDVNVSLFPSSNSTSRGFGSGTDGRTRQHLKLGTRGIAQLAADGFRYSRVLGVESVIYLRVNQDNACDSGGASTAIIVTPSAHYGALNVEVSLPTLPIPATLRGRVS